MEGFDFDMDAGLRRPSFGELSGLRNDEEHFAGGFLEEPVVYRGFEEPLASVGASSFWPDQDMSYDDSFQFSSLTHKSASAGKAMGIKTFDINPVGLPVLSEVVVGPFPSSSIPLELALYVEPNSSFISSKAPFEVLNAVCAWLASDLIDFEVKLDECLIQGVARSGASSCNFCFRAFRNQGPGTVFEFQRRQGCVVFFYSLFFSSRCYSWLAQDRTKLASTSARVLA